MQILRNLSIQVAILLALILSVGLVWKDANVRAAQGVWYSSLYPADWTPCYQDDQGRFIQDFSFAGYHAGEKPLPLELREPIVDVTQAPYFADPTGVSDSTAAIQAAIDDVGSQGGGTVYLPEGTYALSVQPGTRYALSIRHNNVVLAGAGSDKTFLRLDSYRMRQSSPILRTSASIGTGRGETSVRKRLHGDR